MKVLSTIRPRFMIAAALAIAMLMFGSAYVELHQSREELLHVLQEHSLSLAETIERSSANLVLATEQLEYQLSERLLNNATYLARLDSLNLLTERDLRTFASENDVYRINVFDARGNKVLGSHDTLPHGTSLQQRMTPQEMLRPILRGGQKQMIIGLKQARFEEGERYAVAVRRTRVGGGAIVLNLDAADLVEFRKRIGIGKLIRDLGDNSGIDYVVLQDAEGIVAATPNVREMSSIANDSLLGSVLAFDSVVTRQAEFEGHQSFEVAKRLVIEGATVGVLRIGLSMDELRAAEDRMTRRWLIMSIVLAALGALVFTAVVISQNYRLVSEQYSAMQSLTASILENMRDAVVTVDKEDRVTLFNREAEQLFGVKSDTVRGKRTGELPTTVKVCLRSLLGSEEGEMELECASDRRRIVLVSRSSTNRTDGLPESRTLVLKDLTEARRMEREVQRSEKLTAMGRLASSVAHEIRNPLNAISMIAQRYQREFTPRSGAKEYRTLTTVLQKESARVNGIVQQFLQFARPAALRLSPVRAEEFVNHVATLFQGQAEAKGVRFGANCDLPSSMSIDVDQMTQALLNLLQNALDATPPGGEISLRFAQRDDKILFEVADSGSGIPPEIREKVFDLYFTTKRDGTGMGLAITQQIVARHQGSIEVAARPSGGSVFSILLPLSVTLPAA